MAPEGIGEKTIFQEGGIESIRDEGWGGGHQTPNSYHSQKSLPGGL